MEASGHAGWFERLVTELQFELWIGDAAEIRTRRVRKQKTDRQDAQLILRLLLEDRFPQIWVPARETSNNVIVKGRIRDTIALPHQFAQVTRELTRGQAPRLS
jgi:hypothetical protein